jgi:hypothetical protein
MLCVGTSFHVGPCGVVAVAAPLSAAIAAPAAVNGKTWAADSANGKETVPGKLGMA